jgi:hypothetical protein
MQTFISVSILFVSVLLLAGMIRPSYILWFMDVKNRIGVLRVLGPIILGLIALKIILGE